MSLDDMDSGLHSVSELFKDKRMVFIRLPIDLIKKINRHASFEEISAQEWIIQTLEDAIEFESLDAVSGGVEIESEDLDD